MYAFAFSSASLHATPGTSLQAQRLEAEVAAARREIHRIHEDIPRQLLLRLRGEVVTSLREIVASEGDAACRTCRSDSATIH